MTKSNNYIIIGGKKIRGRTFIAGEIFVIASIFVIGEIFVIAIGICAFAVFIIGCFGLSKKNFDALFSHIFFFSQEFFFSDNFLSTTAKTSLIFLLSS